MPSIMHQNMRVYGGFSDVRNEAYRQAFTGWSGLGARIHVAGFTEVRTPRCLEVLTDLCRTLNRRLEHGHAMYVGTSAGGLREYVVTVSTVPIRAQGLVYRDTVTNRWQVPVLAPAAVWDAEALGVGPGLDTRGVAYVVLDLPGERVVAGFVHNTWSTQEPAVLSTSLNSVMSALADAFPGHRVVVGGDFNVPAYNRNGTQVGTRSHVAPTYEVRFAQDAHGNAIPTTVRNPFDYFLVNPGFPDAETLLFPDTRAPGASDHAGVVLQWPVRRQAG